LKRRVARPGKCSM